MMLKYVRVMRLVHNKEQQYLERDLQNETQHETAQIKQQEWTTQYLSCIVF